ncbi:hypothetical protein A4A49_15676 [Nicotiana attenuata]|uniref:Uncharacterized protein n=1 Tax=Nicotiana attenuata TaxID=49451 RepID=A0A314KKF3_NICAT|nr:hypothetical protein A4A49_15676 [Nicotiana attenuata]
MNYHFSTCKQTTPCMQLFYSSNMQVCYMAKTYGWLGENNTDGLKNSGKAGSGIRGVIRDANGSFIAAYSIHVHCECNNAALKL